jgi:hypothetical protein
MDRMIFQPKYKNVHGQTKSEYFEWHKNVIIEQGLKLPEEDQERLAEESYQYQKRSEKWENSKYKVTFDRQCDHVHPNWPEGLACWYISFSMKDGGHLIDWREIQEMKNQVVGEEHEAVMLFPKDSRCMDTANQFHLYIIGDKGQEFPVGWQCQKAVTDETDGKADCNQRKLNKGE